MSSNTKRIVDFLEPYCPGWQRSTGTRTILGLIQQCLDELFDYDGAGLIWNGAGNDGMPPYLQTVAGTYEYDITAANLSCDAITVSIGGTSYTVRAQRVVRIFTESQASSSNYGQLEPKGFDLRGDRWVSKVDFVCYPAAELTTCRIRFEADPGTTTDKYFCEFTWEAPRLLSEQIRLPIAPRFEGAIHDFVIGQVQKYSNGRTNEHLARFYSGTADHPIPWIEQFRSSTNEGDNLFACETVPRMC